MLVKLALESKWEAKFEPHNVSKGFCHMPKKTWFAWLLAFSFAISLAACGTSTTQEKTSQDGVVSSEKSVNDGGISDTSPKEGSTKDTSSTDPIGNISGFWTIKDTPTSNCGDDQEASWTATITQTGSQIELNGGVGCLLKGTLHGNQLKMTGACAEDVGTTTLSDITLTVDPSLKKLTGSSTWSWTDQTDTCQGTSKLEATKQ